MAPPSTRRPGFSRRAQFGLFFGYVVAVAGVLLAVLLLVIAAIDPRGFAALKGAALDVTAPATGAGRSVVGLVTGAGGSVTNYWDAAAQNASLRQQLAQAQRDLISTKLVAYENRRLQALLGIPDLQDNKVVAARIVGSSLDSPRRYGTLSAGATHGVRPGQPVRGPDGLIGRVLETGRWASRVLLVTDGESNVPVRSVRDGTPALAVGRGDGFIELRTLEVGANPFRPGDVLVTSGVGGIYPPGVPVARVVRIEGDGTIARPVAEPARSDYAVVQRVYQPAAGGTLEEAPPPGAVPPVPPPLPTPPQAQTQTPATPDQRQQDPRYQPALQQPQPTALGAGRAPPPASPARPPQ